MFVFARESLFNILLNYYSFEETDVLDLFSGTGCITYEFASRGAQSIVSIEKNPSHHAFIQNTCHELNMEMVNVIRGDAFNYLKRPYQDFDIIFEQNVHSLSQAEMHFLI